MSEALGVAGDGVPDEKWLIDGPWLIPDPACAKEIVSLLERQDAYELIEVACYPTTTDAPSIGFDVGYWASGNFSLICDTAVWPLWHPPPLEALAAIGERVFDLNEAVLFPDAGSAKYFRNAYRAQPWAESEEGTGFEIVEIAPLGTT